MFYLVFAWCVLLSLFFYCPPWILGKRSGHGLPDNGVLLHVGMGGGGLTQRNRDVLEGWFERATGKKEESCVHRKEESCVHIKVWQSLQGMEVPRVGGEAPASRPL